MGYNSLKTSDRPSRVKNHKFSCDYEKYPMFWLLEF